MIKQDWYLWSPVTVTGSNGIRTQVIEIKTEHFIGVSLLIKSRWENVKHSTGWATKYTNIYLWKPTDDCAI